VGRVIGNTSRTIEFIATRGIDMIKKLLLIVIAAFLPLLAFAQGTKKDAELVQIIVRTFYSWYLQYEGKQVSPVFDDREVYQYLTTDTVKYVRDLYAVCDGEPCICSINYDYFIKAQDEDAKDWLENMKISQPIFSENKAIVAVTMGKNPAMKRHLIVVLKATGGVWKIFDVMDANDRD
jgi:hypothetical protein